MRKYLQQSSSAFVIWTALAAFLTYSAMYAFRKPLSAGTFSEYEMWGMSYKVILVITQVFGYLTAKFIGIKVIAELSPKNRVWLLIGLIAIAEFALLLFAITPYPYGFLWIFFNGLPLGLIWGIVFSYIEGRKFTDVLATFLSVSFIISSGVVKTIGRLLVENWGVSEFWMPVLVGALFFPLIYIAASMLEMAPEPSEEDKKARTERLPMKAAERRALFNTFALGLTAILFVNFVMTIGRDIKDNFLVEIWQSLNVDITPSIFAKVETLVGIIVLALLALLVFVKNNAKAFQILHINMLVGFLLVIASTYLFQIEVLGAWWWMLFHGVGLYLSYIAFQSLYFERFIATLRVNGNVGFLIYLSDFIGYLGSCLILIIKEVWGIQVDWSAFFIYLTYVMSVVGIVGVIVAQMSFNNKGKLIIKH